MDLMSIGEFWKRSRLSPKALRLYDEVGLLTPARVDPDSGYRFYGADQLERARLVAGLRRIGVPLAEVGAIVDLEPRSAAERIREHWSGVEADHSARGDLANYLVEHLLGKRAHMFEVRRRQIPARRILCLKRNVDGWDAAWALGKEFIGILRSHAMPRIDGISGAVYCIYHGEVSEDSDGPLEWCRPVPDDLAQELADVTPELELRTEPAHEEVYVHMGKGGQINSAEWQLASEAMHEWAMEHLDPEQAPSDLGLRVTYEATGPRGPDSAPDCDFAVPIN